jgi:hypothetical protein
MSEATNNNVMSSLSTKIYEILSAPDTIIPGAPKEQNVFYTFATPGVAIAESDLNFGDLSTKEQIKASGDFALLVNNIPNPDKAWSLTGKKIWDIYHDAITNITLPDSTLSDREQSMLTKAQNYLVQTTTQKDPFTGDEKKIVGPSGYVKAYTTYQSSYTNALASYNNVRIQANLPTATSEQIQQFNLNGPALRNNVITAYQSWEGEGYKDSVEEARGIVANLTGKGPAAMYSDLRANYDIDKRATIGGDTYLLTSYFPDGVLGTKYDGSWTKFYFELKDASTYQQSSSTSWGASGGASWGLWHASTSAEYGSSQSEFQADTKGLKLSVELIQVPLLRAWLNATIFTSRGWKWDRSSGFGPISNGESPPNLNGLMPIFPTSMIIARNLVITQDMTSEKNTAAMKSISTSASGGWGPFSIKGNYSSKDSTETHNYTATDSGIMVPGTQIIAFICEKLPLCPNPDPNLPWAS